jgi:hypothetical protein
MEQLVKNPVLGAFFNCIAFGLADLYVGHFATAIFKLLLYFIGTYMVVNLVQRWTPNHLIGQLVTAVQCVYILFALVTGYMTVLKSRSETHPTN